MSINFNRFDGDRLQSSERTNKKRNQPRQKLIVWLDTNSKKVKGEFDNKKYYSDANKCLDEISEMLDTDIYFLLSCDVLSNDEIDNFLSILQSFIQIRRIYALHTSPSTQHPQRSTKTRYLSTEPSEQQMQRELRAFDEHISFEFSVASKDATLEWQTSNKQEVSFIYSQLFKQLLLVTDPADSDQAEKEKAEMIAYCRHIYTEVNDRPALTFLDRYEASRDASAIWWYTCDGFLYRMVNDACRAQNIETMYAMRGYIRDVHREIEHLSNSCPVPLVLYRGQQLRTAAFHEMKTKLGGLLSIHSFFSTTLDRDLALVFAGTMDDTVCVSVLFEITVLYSDVRTSPFANINSVSAFGDAEQEYLFSFGCVFRIHTITQCSTVENIWLVKLTLTTDSDPELVYLIEHMWTHNLRGRKDSTKFARLMLDMGEGQLAQDVYLSALQEPCAKEDLGFVYNQLGCIYHKKGDYDLSLAFFEKALAYSVPGTEDNGNSMISAFLGMAEAHGLKNDWTASFECAQKALAVLNAYSTDAEEEAYCLHALGTALLEQEQLTEAVGYFQRALDIRGRILPPSHRSLAVSYNDLGSAYRRQGRYEEALSAYEMCLEIRRRSLPEDHWAFAVIYNNLANVLYWLDRDDEALEWSEQAVETATRTLGMDHPVTDTCRTTFEGISATCEESKGN